MCNSPALARNLKSSSRFRPAAHTTKYRKTPRAVWNPAARCPFTVARASSPQSGILRSGTLESLAPHGGNTHAATAFKPAAQRAAHSPSRLPPKKNQDIPAYSRNLPVSATPLRPPRLKNSNLRNHSGNSSPSPPVPPNINQDIPTYSSESVPPRFALCFRSLSANAGPA